MYVYVRMHVSMYVCIHAFADMCVRMYACMYVRMDLKHVHMYAFVGTCICILCIHACMYALCACMYVSTGVCLVCMYVSMRGMCGHVCIIFVLHYMHVIYFNYTSIPPPKKNLTL